MGHGLVILPHQLTATGFGPASFLEQDEPNSPSGMADTPVSSLFMAKNPGRKIIKILRPGDKSRAELNALLH